MQNLWLTKCPVTWQFIQLHIYIYIYYSRKTLKHLATCWLAKNIAAIRLSLLPFAVETTTKKSKRRSANWKLHTLWTSNREAESPPSLLDRRSWDKSNWTSWDLTQQYQFCLGFGFFGGRGGVVCFFFLFVWWVFWGEGCSLRRL